MLKKLPPTFFIKKITANFLQAIHTDQKLECIVTETKTSVTNKDLHFQYTIKFHGNPQH